MWPSDKRGIGRNWKRAEAHVFNCASHGPANQLQYDTGPNAKLYDSASPFNCATPEARGLHVSCDLINKPKQSPIQREEERKKDRKRSNKIKCGRFRFNGSSSDANQNDKFLHLRSKRSLNWQWMENYNRMMAILGYNSVRCIVFPIWPFMFFNYIFFFSLQNELNDHHHSDHISSNYKFFDQ